MFRLKSKAFTDSGSLPIKYTIDGEKVAPPLSWEDIPKGTKSFALTMTDSDAPPQAWPGIFIHWIVYDIPASVTRTDEGKIPAGAKTLPNTYAAFGMKDFATTYGPPWPPDKAHRYVFTLFALRVEKLNISPEADFNAFIKAILPETIAATTLVGLYGPAKTPLPSG